MTENNLTDRDAAGLTTAQAEQARSKYGKNELVPEAKESFFKKTLHVVAEPMFLLLIAAAVVYFLLGEPRDGAIMLVFVVAIITIDAVQEWKTDKTLSALKDLSAPRVRVLRDGQERDIPSTDLVPGDVMLLFEGVKIPADGFVLRCSDLCTDESSLTGEAQGVWKQPAQSRQSAGDHWRRDYCYAGTMVTQGTAAVLVEKTGQSTEYGRIGKTVAEAPDRPTPLQKQTGKLVRACALLAVGLFVLIGVITFFNTASGSVGERLTQSVLSGITLAMAMIPEEFPVILTVFLSMGAWRLAKKSSLVRRLPSVETLGAVSVLCVDKTGTITMNKMTVEDVWAKGDARELARVMGMACEPQTYDPMEKAMLDYCAGLGLGREELFLGKLEREYAFTNELKMMGHLWNTGAERVLAAKGSPERILELCDVGGAEREAVSAKMREFSKNGLRVIAVGRQRLDAQTPETLCDCRLELLGVVGLADPPREGVREDIELCRRAGIRVVMITGDNGETASAIARRVGITDSGSVITGDMLEAMSDDELRAAAAHTGVFSRVIPEHKMRIVRALRENGEIVAMTGDGVNDAPAMKHADIGIAMGKRGSEVSREAADLVLLDDNFSTIVDTVRDGRRIYSNIRKAVGYIFTIHIPIALSSLIAPMLGISAGALFLLPLHVVLLELIIDPTCSIVLERQPAESDVMDKPPRDPKEKLVTAGIFTKSILQGLVVFAGSFLTYMLTMRGDESLAPQARSMGLAIIMLANLFLVLVNSSDTAFAYHSLRALARDKVMWAVVIGTLALMAVVLYTPLSAILKLAPLGGVQLLIALGAAAACVLWYELVKLAKKRPARR